MSTDSLPAGLDLDTLAAFMDGALGPQDRARVEALLADSTAGQEVLAEAVRLRLELEGADPGSSITSDSDGDRGFGSPGADPLPEDSGSWSQRIGVVVPVAAAAGLIILFIGLQGKPLPLHGPAPTLVETASLVLDGDWAVRSWTEYRGGEEILTPNESAFRSGALWTGFLACWTADAPEAGREADRLVDLLEVGALKSASVALVQDLRDRAGSGTATSEARQTIEQADRLLAATSAQPWYDWGRALETVRLAAASDDVEFLTSERVRDLVGGLSTDGLGERERAAVLSVREHLEARPIDVGALRPVLEDAFAELGG